MKVPISFKINIDVFNELKRLNVKIQPYINTLLYEDLIKMSLTDSKLHEAIKKAQAEERKNQIIKEMKIIGALGNIAQRVQDMSKGDMGVMLNLIEQNLELLEIEFNNTDYSPKTRNLIKGMYSTLQTEKKKLVPRESALKKLKDERTKDTDKKGKDDKAKV